MFWSNNAIEWRQLALIVLIPLILGSIGVAAYAASTPTPMDETVTIAPYGHFVYNQTLPAGKTVNIQLVVYGGLPSGRGGEVLLQVLDAHNYWLRIYDLPPYSSLFLIGAVSQTSLPWEVPADGTYYFIVDNPNPSDVTVGVKIGWTLETLPVLQVVLVLSSVLIGFAAIEYVERPLPIQPQFFELRGDLDMIPDVISSAPHRLHYIVITEPSDIRCAICKTHIELDDDVLVCPHCGNISHTNHILNWVRTKGYCPACGEHLKERDLQRQRPY